MFSYVSLFSIARRAFARSCELIAVGEFAEVLNWLPGFHAEVFGPSFAFYLLVAFAGSAVFDLIELIYRPDLS